MGKILYVCTGNTCRSPMAAGIFNKLAREYGLDVVAESAGLATKDGLPPSENAVKACAEIGIDISNHKSREFSKLNLDEYARFLTMSFDHANLLLEMGVPHNKIEVLSGTDHGVPDPYGFGMGIYRSCRDVIKRDIEKSITKYLKEGENATKDSENEWG